MGVRAEPSRSGRPAFPRVTACAIAAAVAILLLSGCASNVVPVMPKPSEALMVDCPAPSLIPDAENQTADDINIERAEVAKYAVCWRGRFYGLRAWVKGMSK